MQTNKTHKCKENRPKLQKVQSCPSVKKSSNMQDMGKSLASCKAISKKNLFLLIFKNFLHMLDSKRWNQTSFSSPPPPLLFLLSSLPAKSLCSSMYFSKSKICFYLLNYKKSAKLHKTLNPNLKYCNITIHNISKCIECF